MWKGRLGPIRLALSDTTFTPTTVSNLVAGALRVEEGDVAIDVGCGSGILSIIAAKLGARRVYAIDKSPDVIEVGRANAEANQVSDRISFYHGDLFEPLDPSIEADVIIGDVSGIPDTLADESGWFPTRGGGGERGERAPHPHARGGAAPVVFGRPALPAHRIPSGRELDNRCGQAALQEGRQADRARHPPAGADRLQPGPLRSDRAGRGVYHHPRLPIAVGGGVWEVSGVA